MRQDLVKCKLDSINNSGTKPKGEEENATLALKGQHEQQRKKKDVSKIKCFRCGEFGHYSMQCPLKRKDKDEKHDPQVATARVKEEEFAMILSRYLQGRGGVS